MHKTDFEVLGDGSALAIELHGERRRVIEAALLWAECPSAQGRMRRLRGEHLNPPRGLAIRAIREIGAYGINIAFSDGHDRGIYPWSYLDALAAKPKLEDFLTD